MNASNLAKALVCRHIASAAQLLQATSLIAFWWLSQRLSEILQLPISGSLLGLMLLWGMLEFKVVRMDWLEEGADGLLQHLMLYFVPAMLALVDHPELLSMLGVKLAAAIVISTVIVMSGTACIVELGFRIRHASNR